MSKISRRVAATAALVASVLVISEASANTLRMANSAPPGTVWAMQTERWTQNVEKVSNGALRVNAYMNSQLGSEQDVLQQVARGRIDMAGVSTAAAAALVPELALLDMPFLFSSTKQQDCVMDKLVAPTEALLAKKNLQFLSWTHVGETNFVGRTPYVTPDSIKGLRARAQANKVNALMWTSLGANPIPVALTEWNSAHQSGLVDVSQAPIAFYFYSGLGKLAPVMTVSKSLDMAGIAVMNKQGWDRLTLAEKDALIKAGDMAPLNQLRAEVRGFESKVIEMHKTAGGTVVELTPEQRDAWRNNQLGHWPKSVEAIGGQAAAYWSAIKDGLNTCAK